MEIIQFTKVGLNHIYDSLTLMTSKQTFLILKVLQYLVRSGSQSLMISSDQWKNGIINNPRKPMKIMSSL